MRGGGGGHVGHGAAETETLAAELSADRETGSGDGGESQTRCHMRTEVRSRSKEGTLGGCNRDSLGGNASQVTDWPLVADVMQNQL